jgi:hypothetical protein
MLEFLGSNREMAPTPWAQRVVFWSVYLTFTARLCLVQLLGLLSSLRGCLAPGARLLWVVLLATGIPVWTHNFHLDRFLIPSAPALWVLAALGLALLVPVRAVARACVLAPAAALLLLFPTLDGPWVAARLGLLDTDEATRAYILGVLQEKPRLGADRPVWTPGIAPEAARAILDLVTAEVGPQESVGWIGESTELPPAALHIALLAASGNRARFLDDAHRPVDVSFNDEDPAWTTAQLSEFVARFDVVIATDPPDVKERSRRAFTRRYAGLLSSELGWQAKPLGQVLIPKDAGGDLGLTVYALRPPGGARQP